MSNFDAAVEYVILNETGGRADGGLTSDEGGLTKWGIAAKFHPGVDIANLTREDAIEIYRHEYWLFEGVTSDRIATKLLDLYVNMEHDGIKCLQWALGYLHAGPVVADGVWGPNTLEYVNATEEQPLIDELKMRLVRFRYEKVKAEPQREGELLGWWRRDVKG